MTREELKPEEKLLVSMMGKDPNYTLYKCKDHGVYAVKKRQDTRCPVCKKESELYVKSKPENQK